MTATTASELADEIEREVVAGRLRPGDQLPPVRAQAETLGVSPTTVAAAYRRLRDRGIVVGKARQGTRIAPRPAPLGAGNRPASPPASAVDAMTGNPDPILLPSLDAAIRAVGRHAGLLYGSPMVDTELLDAARANIAADGIDTAHLTVTSGAMDAVERGIAAQGFRIGDRIGVEDPGHVPVHQLARSLGLELVGIPVDGNGVTPGGLAAALDRGVSAVVITPRAQNPTGAALSPTRAGELTELLAACPDVLVILDDHAGPVAGAGFVGIGPTGPHWATIRSLSKSLGPDLRIALVAGDAQTIDRVEVALANGPGWVSRILQKTAAHLLTDPATIGQVGVAATTYRARRRRMIEALAAGGVSATGSSGLNVWIPVADEQAVVEAARVAGYAIRAGAPYRLGSSPAVRVTITRLTDQQIDELSSVIVGTLRGRPATPQM